MVVVAVISEDQISFLSLSQQSQSTERNRKHCGLAGLILSLCVTKVLAKVFCAFVGCLSVDNEWSSFPCCSINVVKQRTMITVHYTNPFEWLLFQDNWVSRYQKDKTSLELRQEIMRFRDGSGINWTIYRQSASRCRQITTPTYHTIFTGWMLLLTPNQQCQSTEGK